MLSGRLHGVFNKWLRKKILQSNGNMCFFCGEPMEQNDMTLDHVIPLKYQKQYTGEQLALVHNRCNLIKSTHIVYTNLIDRKVYMFSLIGGW
jgi:5-methylcytosine-specific restriction endonuclease McrA